MRKRFVGSSYSSIKCQQNCYERPEIVDSFAENSSVPSGRDYKAAKALPNRPLSHDIKTANIEHKLHEVTTSKLVVRPHTLEIQFDDGVSRVANFEDVLEGELYGPLQDPNLFNSVKLDRELGNLVWHNGAVADPEILHDWPERS
jgi:hypothetical protein